MADLWLESTLTHGLRPVMAPDSLWDRIEGKQAPKARRESSPVWMWWPIAAALILTIAGGVAFRGAVNRESGIAALAMEELRKLNGGGQLDFRSDDPREIAGWVKTHAGINLDLPGGNAVRMLGVRLVERDGSTVAVIAYQAREGTATLVVSGPGTNRGRGTHRFTTAEQGRVYSWKMREQEYAIASTAHDPHVACLLCHSQPQLTLN